MSKIKKNYSPEDDDFDVLYLDDDDTDIEEWVDNEEDAEIDWISDDDDIQIGRLDDDANESHPYKAQPKTKQRKEKKSSSGRSVSKAGGKAVQAGGKAVKSTAKGVFKVIQVFAHLITLALIGLIMYEVGIHFWNNYSSFGSIETILAERNYILAGFLAVAAVLLLYELISFFWALSKPRAGKDGRYDSGRGLFSFLLIGVLAFAAQQFNGYIPEFHDALLGLKEGAILYGSLFNILLPVCIGGVVSCLIRKLTNR